MQSFENTASISASLGATEISDLSTVLISLDDIYFCKEVDKRVWHDGPLTYTITVANYSETDPLTDISVQDMIDLNFTRLMTDSITFDPAAAGSYTYEPTSGDFTITLNDIQPQNTVIITFQVNRVLP